MTAVFLCPFIRKEKNDMGDVISALINLAVEVIRETTKKD